MNCSRKFFFLFIFFSFHLYGKPVYIKGIIKERPSQQPVFGANIKTSPGKASTTSDEKGNFALTVEEGQYKLTVTHLGYKEFTMQIDLRRDTTIQIALDEEVYITNELVVSAEQADQNVKGTETGTTELNVTKLKSLPYVLGEVDPIKIIQLTPGVTTTGEGTSGFYVRGGSADQNLILLDDAVVTNPSHLFGFFSVFNGDVVKNVKLTKGNIPSYYSGRLSSVLDIEMREGDKNKMQYSGGLGLISSRLCVEGPLKPGKSSFLISGRRTYLDFITKPFISPSSSFSAMTGYYFYDLNAKISNQISENDLISITSYMGSDKFKLDAGSKSMSNSILWGNKIASGKWIHFFSRNTSIKNIITYSQYDFQFKANQSQYQFSMASGIKDWNYKTDLNWVNEKHDAHIGAELFYHTFQPTNINAGSKTDNGVNISKNFNLYSLESGIFINDDFDISNRIRINAGIRNSTFVHLGPYQKFEKDLGGKTIDTTFFEKGELLKTYNNIEPRFSVRYTVNETSSIKASLSKNYQYIHLVSVSSASLPTDIWIPSTFEIKPQHSWQYSGGYFRNFNNNIFETSIEVYYRKMYNQVEFLNGFIEIFNNNRIEQNLTRGTGKSYGAELFLKKTNGRATGWVGYTLSRTTRLFDDINEGKEFFAKYDRRHDLSLLTTYKLNEKWTFSAVFVYATGHAMTLPVERMVIAGKVYNIYGEINSFRMPSYHRLDVSANYQLKKRKWTESSLNFSIYNVYNRANPYYIYFETIADTDKYEWEVNAKQVSLFPILPSITWNFKF